MHVYYQSFSNVDFVCMTLNNWLQFKEGRGNQFQASALLLLFYSTVKIKIREQPFDLCELSRGSSQGLEKNLIGRLFHNWYVQVNLCQKHLFLDQLTHNMTKDCSLIYQFSTWKLHAIWSYNEHWDFPRAGSSLFLPRFSGLTFLRFLGPFFIFSEIFASGVLYFLLVCEPGHRKLSFTLSNVYSQE